MEINEPVFIDFCLTGLHQAEPTVRSVNVSIEKQIVFMGFTHNSKNMNRLQPYPLIINNNLQAKAIKAAFFFNTTNISRSFFPFITNMGQRREEAEFHFFIFISLTSIHDRQN